MRTIRKHGAIQLTQRKDGNIAVHSVPMIRLLPNVPQLALYLVPFTLLPEHVYKMFQRKNRKSIQDQNMTSWEIALKIANREVCRHYLVNNFVNVVRTANSAYQPGLTYRKL